MNTLDKFTSELQPFDKSVNSMTTDLHHIPNPLLPLKDLSSSWTANKTEVQQKLTKQSSRQDGL